MTTNAAWSGRSSHTSVVNQGKIYVMGGLGNHSSLNDVWSSADGVTWTQVPANAAWSGRHKHTSVVFKDRIWVLGGYDGSNNLGDVWYSYMR